MNEPRTSGVEPAEPPLPPVPEDADLRQFRHFAIDVHRLLTSETWVLATGAEAKAAMTLWLQAFHSIPAGSLPDNDRMLAYLSMAGAEWDSVREHALRGWERHADGRLYHPVVTEKVLDALKRSEAYQHAKEANREKMRQWREKQRVPGGEPPGNGDVTVTPESRNPGVTGRKRKMKEKEKRKIEESLSPPTVAPLPGLDAPDPPPQAAAGAPDPVDRP